MSGSFSGEDFENLRNTPMRTDYRLFAVYIVQKRCVSDIQHGRSATRVISRTVCIDFRQVHYGSRPAISSRRARLTAWYAQADAAAKRRTADDRLRYGNWRCSRCSLQAPLAGWSGGHGVQDEGLLWQHLNGPAAARYDTQFCTSRDVSIRAGALGQLGAWRGIVSSSCSAHALLWARRLLTGRERVLRGGAVRVLGGAALAVAHTTHVLFWCAGLLARVGPRTGDAMLDDRRRTVLALANASYTSAC